jgi:hypothetical protein
MRHLYRITKLPDVGDILDSVEALPVFDAGHGPGRRHGHGRVTTDYSHAESQEIRWCSVRSVEILPVILAKPRVKPV